MPNISQQRKKVNKGSVVEKEQVVWWKNPSLLVAVLSIVASTLIGVLSINNAKAIARLNQDVYVPKLQYRLDQDQVGSLSLEIANNGQVSAKEVVVSLSWKTIGLKSCFPSPPYQNVKPIEPIVDGNLSYHVDTLPVGGLFTINCNIYSNMTQESLILQWLLSQYSIPVPARLPYSSDSPSDSLVTPTPQDNTIQGPFYLVPSEAATPEDHSFYEGSYFELEVTQDILSVYVVSDNSMPAVEMGQRGKILVEYQSVLPSPTPVSPPEP